MNIATSTFAGRWPGPTRELPRSGSCSPCPTSWLARRSSAWPDSCSMPSRRRRRRAGRCRDLDPVALVRIGHETAAPLASQGKSTRTPTAPSASSMIRSVRSMRPDGRRRLPCGMGCREDEKQEQHRDDDGRDRAHQHGLRTAPSPGSAKNSMNTKTTAEIEEQDHPQRHRDDADGAVDPVDPGRLAIRGLVHPLA